MTAKRDRDPDPEFPQAQEAEKAVLGCLLLDPVAGLTACAGRFNLHEAVFYHPQHAALFEAVRDLVNAPDPPADTAALIMRLDARGQLARLGGYEGLSALMDGVPSAVAIHPYLDALLEAYTRRRILQVALRLAQDARSGEVGAGELVARWTMDQRPFLDGSRQGDTASIEDLQAFEPDDDPNCLIGIREGRTTRFICRGYGAWLIGASGIGKSSLLFQMGICAAAGLRIWGISPMRPLRVLLVQAENDIGDMAEMSKGILAGLGIDPFRAEDVWEAVRANLRTRTVTGRIGASWCTWLRGEIKSWQADLVLVDPLLSFAGIEIGRQDQCTRFLREWLDPVLRETGCALIGAHHSGKPKRDERNGPAPTLYDLAYAGLGSSELVNWARAIMILQPAGDVFRLLLAKRGKRAGAVHPDGRDTSVLWLRQATDGSILWIQCEPPQESQATPSREGGRPSKIDELLARVSPFVDSISTDTKELRSSVIERMRTWALATIRVNISDRTAIRLLDLLFERGFLDLSQDSKQPRKPIVIMRKAGPRSERDAQEDEDDAA